MKQYQDTAQEPDSFPKGSFLQTHHSQKLISNLWSGQKRLLSMSLQNTISVINGLRSN